MSTEDDKDEVWTPVPIDHPRYGNPDLFTLHERPVANTAGEYLDSLLNYIEIKFSAKGLACTMSDLNRRYSSIARRFAYPVKNAVQALYNEGKVAIESYRGNLLCIPAAHYETFLNDPENGSAIIVSLCEKTLLEEGRKPTRKALPKIEASNSPPLTNSSSPDGKRVDLTAYPYNPDAPHEE